MEARFTDGNSEILLAIASGRAIRFEEQKVRPTGRGAIGVGGIEVDDASDEVIGMICVNKDDKSRTVLVVSEKGYGKRSPLDEYRITNRGGKGVKTISVTEKTGRLVGILDVTEQEDLMITCKSGVTIRMPVNGISSQGRATQGVKLIRLDENDEIAAITKLDKLEDEIAQPVGEMIGEGSEAVSDATAGQVGDVAAGDNADAAGDNSPAPGTDETATDEESNEDAVS